MGIIQLPTPLVGQGGLLPATKKMVTTDSLDIITTAGYLNAVNLEGYPLSKSDILEVLYDYDEQTKSGTFELFTVSISNGVITLNQWSSPGDVILPVVSGNFTVFSGTSGVLADDGYSPSDDSKTKVVMADGATVVNEIATFSDVSGTIQSSGSALGEAASKSVSNNALPSVVSISGSTVANEVPVFADTTGTLTSASAAAVIGADTTVEGTVFAENLTVGSPAGGGGLGSIISYPITASNGSFIFTAANAGANFNTTISNGTMGQNTTYTIPDIGAATGGIVVSTSNIRMKSVAKAAVPGGNLFQTITDAFCTSSSNVIANYTDTTTADINIFTVNPGDGSFTLFTNLDPGASHLSYIIIK